MVSSGDRSDKIRTYNYPQGRVTDHRIGLTLYSLGEIIDGDINKIIDFFCDSIKKALLENKNIELRGFGTFFLKKIKEKYSARNPKTGELLYVPEKNKISFRASKNLLKKINE